MTPTTWGWLILACPLAGFLLNTVLWQRVAGRAAGVIASLAVGGAFVAAIGALVTLQDRPEEARQLVSSLFDYANTAGIEIKFAILVDPLALFMALIVSGVSFLIHVYSVAYMTSDRGYNRYFSYLNFFVFSMLFLVLAANFVLLIVGWALVGFASYALISFWYRRGTAVKAGMKAFVINVVGDVGLVLAALFIFRETNSFDLLTVFNAAPGSFNHNDSLIVAVCLLLVVGAFAKSAQIPLHTWLPDAMEGPTPVSALIHAATMVTAGVYLIARTHTLFELAPTAADITAILATLTLFFAATVALVQTDLKRIIAYSTISQIGYMILGVSLGAYGAGMFHLMTHAFFKALLFMGAGSVIAAMSAEQSIDKMSGFRKAMPLTFITFTVGALALAGVPGTAGFFSKDDVLAVIAAEGGWHWALYVVATIAALITAVYAFRVVFRVFFGEPCEQARELQRGHLYHAEQPTNPATGEIEDTDTGFPGPNHQVAERERTMAIPMMILAVLALGAGWLQVPGLDSTIGNFLAPSFADSLAPVPEPSSGLEAFSLIDGGVIAIVGILIAALLWLKSPQLVVRLRQRFSRPHTFLRNKWYFDELIGALVVRPTGVLSRFLSHVFERVVVQGVLVGGSSALVAAGSTAVRLIQSGYLRNYALLLVGALSALTLYFLMQQ